MPKIADFAVVRQTQAVITINLTPPVSITGWNLQLQVGKRFDWSSGLITKSLASGFIAGQSGLSIVDATVGILNASFAAGDTSGWDFGNYAYELSRLGSGVQGSLTQGFISILPTKGT